MNPHDKYFAAQKDAATAERMRRVKAAMAQATERTSALVPPRRKRSRSWRFVAGVAVGLALGLAWAKSARADVEEPSPECSLYALRALHAADARDRGFSEEKQLSTLATVEARGTITRAEAAAWREIVGRVYLIDWAPPAAHYLLQELRCSAVKKGV